jgi:signal transduction histidine kinase
MSNRWHKLPQAAAAWLRRTSVGKLYLAMAAAAGAVIVLMAASLHYAVATLHAADSLYNHGYLEARSAAQLDLVFAQHRRLVESAPAEVDRRRIAQTRLRLKELDTSLVAILDEARKRTDEVRWREILGDLDSLTHHAGAVMYLADNFAQDKALHAAQNDYGPLADKIAGRILEWHAATMELENRQTETVIENANALVWWVSLCGVAALVLIGPLGLAERRQSEAVLRRAKERAESAEQQLARAKAQLIDSIEAMPAGFVLYDADDRLVLTNSKYTELYAGPTDLPGMRFVDALRTSLDRGAYAAAVGREEEWLAERLAMRKAATGSSEQQLSNGRWLRVVDRPTSDGGLVGIRVDITELKQRELDLERAKRDAEAANVTKTQFLANMSHELRTPLNAIIGFSEALTMGIGGSMNAKQAEYVGDIYRSGQHLLSVINDVLDLSKIDVGHLELRPEEVSVDDMVSSCVTLLRSRAMEGAVALKVNLPNDLKYVFADSVRLKQILINLMSNAIKFTPSGGRVDISIVRTASAVVFTVADTGVGMRPEDVPIALEPFRQVDGSLARRHEGTGLGLPLSKRLVELHGGHLSIVSEVGVGTRVQFELPNEQTAAAA